MGLPERSKYEKISKIIRLPRDYNEAKAVPGRSSLLHHVELAHASPTNVKTQAHGCSLLCGSGHYIPTEKKISCYIQ